MPWISPLTQLLQPFVIKMLDMCALKARHKFIGKTDIIPNGLEKYMTFILNKNFIDSMQFMNSSLEKLVKNL